MVKLFGRDIAYTFKAKYHYKKHTIGKRKVWVKLPHYQNMQRLLIARKLLSMNYVLSRPLSYAAVGEARNLKDLAEWDKRVKAASELPIYQKYGGRSVRTLRSKPNVSETGETSMPLPTDQVFINNPRDPICDLDDLATNTSRYLFEKELAKQEEQETEEWQCRHWRRQVLRDYKSLEMNAVISNARVAALCPKDIKISPTLAHIFMENIRYAVYTHQWRLALKGVEGLIEEMNNMNKCWLMWNGAFLGIANLYKDDLNKIVEYATYAKRFINCYPRRLGIEVAVWLTQKGHFSRGYQLQQDWHDNDTRPGVWEFARDKDNAKRKNIDFIAILFRAVFHYSCWKRDKILFKDGTFNGDEFTIKQCGQTALGLFESLLPISEETGCDSTIFIHPLIELMIEYKDIFAAKETFKVLVVRNYGHVIFECLYLQFLETYFPFLEEEIVFYNKRREKSTAGKQQLPNKIHDQKLRFYIAQKYKQKEAVPLVRKQKPAFSW